MTWKPIPGCPGYEISDTGRVRSLVAWRGRPGPRELSTRLDHGYPRVTLGAHGKAYVHDLVLRAFLGPPPPGMEARHLDGDSSRSVLSNLAWGTDQENAADRLLHGTNPNGEKHPHAKLTAADVTEIRASSLPREDLARRFGVTPDHIRKLRKGDRWKELHP